MNIVEALKISKRIKHESWANWWIEYKEEMDRFTMENGATYLMVPSYIISEEWAPWVEPCKHEPMGDVWVEINCEKCGVKLRATGWEEVK